jgi:endonuclease/exonuclease/phosphatase family protein
MRLSIAYWNTAGRNGLASIVLNSDQEFDIIAIQEPWYNKQTMTVYCPAQAKYRRIFSEGRAALYIHKRHPPNTWTAAAGLDWCRATLKGVTIWSIYSPIPTNQQWTSPLQALTSKEPTGPQVIVGDLNLHHPLWDREGRTTPESSTLLRLARRWHLNLHTPWGEPTRQRHNERDLTIDHAWASAGLPVHYYGDLGLKGSDHQAQLIEVVTNTGTTSRQQRAAQTEG